MSLSTSVSSLSEMPTTTSISNSNESSPRSHDHKPPKYTYTTEELRSIGASMNFSEANPVHQSTLLGPMAQFSVGPYSSFCPPISNLISSMRTNNYRRQPQHDNHEPKPPTRHDTYTIGDVFDFKSLVEEIYKQTPIVQNNIYNQPESNQAPTVPDHQAELASSVADFFRKAQPYHYSPHLLSSLDSSKVVSVSKLEEELLGATTKEK